MWTVDVKISFMIVFIALLEYCKIYTLVYYNNGLIMSWLIC